MIISSIMMKMKVMYNGRLTRRMKMQKSLKERLKRRFFYIYKYRIILTTKIKHKNEKKVLNNQKIMLNNLQSVLFFTTHKAASTFFSRFFKEIEKYSGLVNLDYDSYFAGHQIPVIEATSKKQFINQAYPEKGALIGPMRKVRKVPNIENYKVLLFLRDPRDVLVSYYFSMAYSHSIISKGILLNRKEALSQDLDSFVIRKLPEFKEKYQEYSELLLLDNLLFYKYENMIDDPHKFLKDVEYFIGFTLPQKKREEIIKQELMPPNNQNENKYSHRRSGKSRGFEDKLKPATVELLNSEFKEVLKRFGFE